MAIFTCSIKFTDSRKRSTRRSFQISAATLAAAETIADSVVSALADVSDARVEEYGLLWKKAVTDAEASVSNIDEGMTVRINQVDSLTGLPSFASFNIPAPEASIIDDDGDLVLDEADVAALEDALQTPGVLVAGESVVSFHSGYLDK